MTSIVVHCPECAADIPVPRLSLDRLRGPVRCRICSTPLVLNRPEEARPEPSPDSSSNQETSFRLDGYELLGILGRGGMGVVYSAVRDSGRELVAIKVLPEDCAKHPELIRRFYMEAQSMAALTHPNILPILDRGTIGRKNFIVVDYVPGCNLKQRIADAAPLELDEVVTVASAVAEAVQCCHDHGFVHRDLKPANILLSQGGRIFVTDFGIANLMSRLGEETDHGMAIGTPQYTAPEQQMHGSNADPRADQFSLAVIVYEMLTRRLPQGRFDPPSEFRGDVKPEAEAALMRALSNNPEKRFASIRQFVRAFRKGLALNDTEWSEERQIARAASSAIVEADADSSAAGGTDFRRVTKSWTATPYDPAAEEEVPPVAIPPLAAPQKQSPKSRETRPAPPARPAPASKESRQLRLLMGLAAVLAALLAGLLLWY